MGTALDEQNRTGKPLCVDRYSAIQRPYRAAEVIPREERPAAPNPESPRILTGKQLPPSDKSPRAEAASKTAAVSNTESVSRTAPSDKPENRAIRVSRNSSLVLWLAAVCGVSGGLVSAQSVGALEGVLFTSEGSFLALFLSRLLYGAAFLLAEYLLGFFALGEWLVWLAPLCCGLGTGLSAAAGFGRKGALLLIPSAAITLLAVIFGARCSGEFSAQLLRVVSGSRTGIVLTSEATRGYTLRFFGCLAAVGAAALIEAAVKIS